MGNYIMKRLVIAIPVLLGILFITFVLRVCFPTLVWPCWGKRLMMLHAMLLTSAMV